MAGIEDAATMMKGTGLRSRAVSVRPVIVRPVIVRFGASVPFGPARLLLSGP